MLKYKLKKIQIKNKFYSPFKKRLKFFSKSIITKKNLDLSINKDFNNSQNIKKLENIFPNKYLSEISEFIEIKNFNNNKIISFHTNNINNKITSSTRSLINLKKIFDFEKEIKFFYKNFFTKKLTLLLTTKLTFLRKNILLLLFFNSNYLNHKFFKKSPIFMSKLKTKSDNNVDYLIWMEWIFKNFSIKKQKNTKNYFFLSKISLKLNYYNNKIDLINKEISFLNSKLFSLKKNQSHTSELQNIYINAGSTSQFINNKYLIFNYCNTDTLVQFEDQEWAEWLSTETTTKVTHQNILSELSLICKNELILLNHKSNSLINNYFFKLIKLQKTINSSLNQFLAKNTNSNFTVKSIYQILDSYLSTKFKINFPIHYIYINKLSTNLVFKKQKQKYLLFIKDFNKNITSIDTNWYLNEKIIKSNFVQLDFKNSFSNKKKIIQLSYIKLCYLIYTNNNFIYIAHKLNQINSGLLFYKNLNISENILTNNSLNATFMPKQKVIFNVATKIKTLKVQPSSTNLQKLVLKPINAIAQASLSINLFLKKISFQKKKIIRKSEKHNNKLKTISKNNKKLFNFLKFYKKQRSLNLNNLYSFPKKNYTYLEKILNKINISLFMLQSYNVKKSEEDKKKSELLKLKFWTSYSNLLFLNKIDHQPLKKDLLKLDFNLNKKLYFFNTTLVTNSFTKLNYIYSLPLTRSIKYSKSIVNDKIQKLNNPNILILNFKKARFFPSLTNLKGRLFSTMSLGMFSKFFNKGKSFIKNKSVFLLIASFLRKLILFSEIQGAILIVKRVPLYFKEIISAIYDPVVGFYDSPFNGRVVNESTIKNSFKFTSFMFFNNKPYGDFKNKQKGRLKRKITKRIISINRMVD